MLTQVIFAWIISMTPKAFSGFLVITLLLAAVVEVKVDCQNCNSTGHIDPMPGLENLRALDVDTQPIFEPYLARAACSIWFGYLLGLNLSLVNSGSSLVKGDIAIIAKDPESDQIMAWKIISMEIPAKTTVNVWTYIAIYTKNQPKTTYNVVVDILGAGERPCPVCVGKGKVSLIRWLVYLIPHSESPTEMSITPIIPELPSDVAKWGD